MKKYFILAASALALAGCSSDDYLGGENPGNENGGSTAINFSGATGRITRAADGVKGGSEAATLLGKAFYVLGTKGTLPENSPTDGIVFDNYKVTYKENTAGTTGDNTNDWAYVGVEKTGLHAGENAPTEQSIKYWDYSQPQYDFIAYSIGTNHFEKEGTASDEHVVCSEIKTPKSADYKSFTLKANRIEDFKKCYYTDVTPVVKADYGKPVKLTFKNLTAKVRVAFYETIPGYSVSKVQFYEDESTAKANLTDKTTVTLYTTNNNKIAQDGTITVTYPMVGSNNSANAEYNKAYVTVSDGTADKATAKLEFGSINYVENSNTLATTAREASMAGTKENKYYTAVLPVSDPKPLTLRINYTLTSIDGSGEEIHVYGAKAVIPASYTAWQPNYAYTYIFKISDNTNGSTSTEDKGKEGLFPITFDAVIADANEADFNQETITTVATPSVTTYAFNNQTKKVISAYGNNDEYPASANTDVYFSVTESNTTDADILMKDLDKKGQLYKLSKDVTEAEVIDALQVVASSDNNSITGRNGVKLTQTATNLPTSIPTEDGRGISVTGKSVAQFNASEAGTYAYVYTKKANAESDYTYIITAIPGDDQTTASESDVYYTDYNCSEDKKITSGTLTSGTVYYKKYTNNNNVYGVKVVKIVAGN